jgi:para-aminobenzoate synthetase component 1
MSLPHAREISWRHPADCYEALAAALPGPTAFLDSALVEPRLGRYSYVAADPFCMLRFDGRTVRMDGEPLLVNGDATVADPFEALAGLLDRHRLQHRDGLPPFQGGAIGWLSYELGEQLEQLPAPADPRRRFDDLALAFYDTILAFDHLQERAWIVATGLPETGDLARSARARARTDAFEAMLNAARSSAAESAAGESRTPESSASEAGESAEAGRATGIANPTGGETKLPIRSNFSRPDYETAVQRVIDYILAGDIFQANLTQCFSASLPDHDSPWALYRRLRTLNPATFAAFLDWGEQVIASASPERFLRLRATGEVETRPIKGTRPRGATPEADEALARELLASEKDRAENVMIVDLLRNDLSRVCADHSVEASEICALERYATVHHLVSAVEGRLRPGLGAIDLLRATFPGGSITGAPKIRAMEIIAELEPARRGPYCGSVVWLGFDGAMDSSIVIRSFCIRGREIQFSAGGGIVADSMPASEYDESLDKAAALIRALGGRLEEKAG